MNGAAHIKQFQKRWQQLLYAEALLYAVGFGGMMYLFTHNMGYTILSLLVALVVSVWIKRPWKINETRAVNYIDAHLPQAGYSSGLLLVPAQELSDLSKLQQYRVAAQLEPILPKTRPPQKLFKAALVMFGLVLIGLMANTIWTSLNPFSSNGSSNEDVITFAPKDSLSSSIKIPELTDTKVTVQYPSYTKKPTIQTSLPNIKAVQGFQDHMASRI